MPQNHCVNRILFPNDLPAENIVKAVLVMLQSHHERELERLNEILSGFPDFYTDKLSALWLRIKTATRSDAEALCLFTKVVAAELDGGNRPAIEME